MPRFLTVGEEYDIRPWDIDEALTIFSQTASMCKLYRENIVKFSAMQENKKYI